MRATRRKSLPGTTSLIARSRSTNVGFFRAMLVIRTCSLWFDSGRTVLFSHTIPPARITATRQSGRSRRVMLTPLAFMAAISLSEASRLKV